MKDNVLGSFLYITTSRLQYPLSLRNASFCFDLPYHYVTFSMYVYNINDERWWLPVGVNTLRHMYSAFAIDMLGV